MIQKNDFIEIEFIGRVKGGEIFDTNIPEEAEKLGIRPEEIKPFVVCAGHGMLVSGFDRALEGKEIGKKYKIEIEPKDAFQERHRELVKLIPLKIFTEKKVQPVPGMTLALDNTLVKIISVSGGRVLADFNNPLAGKIIEYDFTIKRKLEDIGEKVNALSEFFLKQKLEFKVEDKKVIFKAEEFYRPVIEMVNKQFKDILGMEMVLELKQEEKNARQE